MFSFRSFTRATRLALAVGLVLTPMLTLFPSTVSAAPAETVECGFIVEYTAPDAGAPSAGTITLGLDAQLTISATANVAPDFETDIAGVMGNGSPTCLALTLDSGGVVTDLAFASQGQICGTVVDLSSTLGVMVLGNRIGMPTFVADAFPALGVFFLAALSTGNQMCLDAVIEPHGFMTGYDAQVAVTGAATLAGSDFQVGAATLPTSLMSANAATALALAEAAAQPAAVAITGDGIIDPNVGPANTAVAFAVTTTVCSSVTSVTATEAVVGAQTFAWSPTSTIQAGTAGAGEIGLRVTVDADGTAHIAQAVFAGCAVVPPPVEESDPGDSTPAIPVPTVVVPVVPPVAPVVAPVVVDVVGGAEDWLAPPTAPTSTSFAMAVFGGGSIERLEAAVRAAGGSGVWVQTSDGRFIVLIVGGASFLAQDFASHFPMGFDDAVAVTIVR